MRRYCFLHIHSCRHQRKRSSRPSTRNYSSRLNVTASPSSAHFVQEARSCGMLCLDVRRIKRWEVIETHGKKRKDAGSGNLQSADPAGAVMSCSENSP